MGPLLYVVALAKVSICVDRLGHRAAAKTVNRVIYRCTSPLPMYYEKAGLVFSESVHSRNWLKREWP
jgi:hypothetical protein